MQKRFILSIDAAINFILGILLLFFNPSIITILGIPNNETYFFQTILGGIFIGITIALLIEVIKDSKNVSQGLGLLGAISINISGGLVLFLWLIFGDLHLTFYGMLILWILVIILLMISSIEFIHNIYEKKIKN